MDRYIVDIVEKLDNYIYLQLVLTILLLSHLCFQIDCCINYLYYICILYNIYTLVIFI